MSLGFLSRIGTSFVLASTLVGATLALGVPASSAVAVGDPWSETTTPGYSIRAVTYGNGLFVAVSELNWPNQVVTSIDGKTWTKRSTPAGRWQSVAYGNGRFVAVAYYGDSANGCIGCPQIMTSTDGINWTAIQAPERNWWRSVTYGNGLFVAVALDGVNRVMTSPDGLTWTARPDAGAGHWLGVAYGGGRFVAVGDLGATRVMTSTDGISWSGVTAPQQTSHAVAYGDGQFVAVAYSGSERVMTSPDGITWTARTSPLMYWDSLAFGNGVFAAAAFDAYENTAQSFMTSPDGINWTARQFGVSARWMGVAYGNGVLVATSFDTPNVAAVTGLMPPRNVSATAGRGQATIQWDSPLSDGGHPVSGYIVTGTPGGSCTTTENTCTISGLSVGVQYSFSVEAQNASGTSPAASANTITPTGSATVAAPSGTSVQGSLTTIPQPLTTDDASGTELTFTQADSAPSCSGFDGLGNAIVLDAQTLPGTYTTRCEGASKTGYSFAYQPGSWTVAPKYSGSGYFAPVDAGVYNIAKGGSVVPLKFRAFAGTAEITDPSRLSLRVATAPCDSALGADAVEELAPKASVLRYDSTTMQFIQNWKAPSTKGKCYLVSHSLDGTAIVTAQFRTR